MYIILLLNSWIRSGGSRNDFVRFDLICTVRDGPYLTKPLQSQDVEFPSGINTSRINALGL